MAISRHKRLATLQRYAAPEDWATRRGFARKVRDTDLMRLATGGTIS
jgi:hypothetical protein